MARLFTFAAFIVFVGIGVTFAWPQANPAPQEKRTATPRTEDEASSDAFAKTAEDFDKAYAAHDADAIVNLFTENGELIIDDAVITGRDAIHAAFTEMFTEFPEATILTEIDSIRFPSPNVAIEVGRTFASRTADETAVARRYAIVHVRNGEEWAIASVREESPEPLTPVEALEPLGWLVGDWIDESDDSTVETTCRWSEDGNWLIQDYHVRLRGGPEMSGTQRIGWDAARQEVRSWAFDSTGGFVEGVWSTDGTTWTVKVNGVAADGAVGSGTRVLTPLGPDASLLQVFHRVLDGEPLPDNEVTVVRRPPMVEVEEPAAEETDAIDPAAALDATDGAPSN